MENKNANHVQDGFQRDPPRPGSASEPLGDDLLPTSPVRLPSKVDDLGNVTSGGSLESSTSPRPGFLSRLLQGHSWRSGASTALLGIIGLFLLIVIGFVFLNFLLGRNSKPNPQNQQAITNAVGAADATSNPFGGQFQAASIHLNRDTVIGNGSSFTAQGQVLLQNTADSSAAFSVQEASGGDLLVADTLNKRVGIGMAPGGAAALQVAGDISSTGTLAANGGSSSLSNQGLRINTTDVCTAAGCLPNTRDALSLQGENAAFYTNAGNLTAGTLGDTRLSSNVARLNAAQTFSGRNTFTGSMLVQNAIDSTGAFQIQNAAGTNTVFNADTANNEVGIGLVPAAGGARLQVGGNLNVNGVYQVGGVSGASLICSGSNLLQGALVSSGLVVGGSCASGSGASTPTLQQVYNASSTPELTVNATNGALTIQDAASPIGANLFEVQSNGGASKYLAVSANGASVVGNLNVTGLYQVNGSQIAANNLSDNVTLAKLTANQTFTGQQTFSLTNGGVVLQDAATPIAGDLLAVTNNGGTTKYLQVTSSGVKAGGFNVCTTAGNCAGVGGGVTTTGGTAGTIAKFTAAQGIGNSIITDNGSTVTIAGALSVNTLTPTAALAIGVTGQNLSLQGAATSLSATSLGITNSLTFATPASANKTITVPNASGTVAVSASGPLALDVVGNLTCPTCLTSGGGGGTAGVSSLNALTGALTLAGTTNQISVTSAGSTITLATPQNLNTASSPTFAGLTLSSSPLGVSSGGTGLSATPLSGQLLIGNGTGYSLATLTAGTGITVTNGAGTIQISSPTAGTCASCANTALSNLASVALNTTLNPQTAAGIDLGSSGLPIRNLYLAGSSLSPGLNNFQITGTATAARTITIPDATGTVCLSTGNCPGVATTLQQNYTASVGGTTPEIKLDSTRGGLDIQDADTSIAANLFTVRASNASGLGAALFGVGSTGQTTFQNSTNSATALQVQDAAGNTLFNVSALYQRVELGKANVIGGRLLFFDSSSSNGITLQAAPPGAGGVLTLPAESGTLCSTASVCAGYASLSANQTFTGYNTLKPTTNSTTAFQVQNASGTSAITVDTTNLRVDVGTNGTHTGQLYVGGLLTGGAVGSVALSASSPSSVSVQGRYAYVANSAANLGSFQVIDVSNPASPTSIASVATGTGNGPQSVYVQGRYAYVVSPNGSGNLQIYDVSNPASPNRVGTVSTGIGPVSIYVQGRYAYVVGNGPNLKIFDVSNPTSPTLAGTTSVGTNFESVYVQGRYAYVADYTAGTLRIFDVSNPTSPASIGSIGTTADGALSVYVQGRYAYMLNYVTSTLKVFDVSNPTSPTLTSSIATGTSPQSVYVQGRYAYIAEAGSSDVRILDISNPSAPTLVGVGNAGGGLYSLYVQGRYAYAVNQTSDTLQVFDLGGAYVQQLEAGGIESATLQTRGDATINGDLATQGGLQIGQSLEVSGNVGASGSALFQASTNATTAFQIQNAAGTNTLLVADTTANKITISNLAISGTITLSGHIITSGTAPAIAAGAGAGTGPTVSIAGNDQAGTITVTTGTSPAAGTLATVTFASAYGAPPRIVLTAVGNVSAGLQYNVGSSATTTFTLNSGTAPAASTTYTFNYWVAQ